MSDKFEGYQAGLEAPADNAAAVTPDDDTDLSDFARALYVGTAGDVAVNLATTGSAIVFKNVAAGTVLPIRVARVLDTSTTADDIVAIW
jgi:hypothetical protein